MSKAIAFINPRVSTSNVGDHFIEDSVKRILKFDPERSVDIDPRKPISAADIDRINRCDAAVIVGTNLWYPQVYKSNRWMFGVEELQQIKVPFVPFGVGTTLHRGQEDRFLPESVAILKQIHERCAESSARDPQTWEMLRKAGIDNVRMTGCPTLYRSLSPQWELRRKPAKEVVVTVRKGQDRNVAVILDVLREKGMQPIIAAQKDHDLYCARRRFPWLRPGVPGLYEFDIKPYQRLVDEAYGAIGWRLHGNMFHLAHGNPAVFFANCSRVRSFAEAYGLPCIYAEDGERIAPEALRKSVEHLLAADTFGQLPARYVQYRHEMIAFLERNGLEHNLATAD